ncbi:hypothetical protein FRC06_001164, partial [Ceratobasidium sp. 370]
MNAAVIQSLPNSREYICKVLKGLSGLGKPSTFVPNHRPRLTGYPDFSVFANGALSKAFSNDKHVALFDFENAVHIHLSGWVDINLNDDSAYASVFSCLEQYASVAQSYYTQDVADLSIMVLTIMALWVALDRLVTSRYNLLLEYSPDIPENLIEVLLLRSSQHLDQATMIQTYLRRRHAQNSLGSVFSGSFARNSLPVRFFNQSPSLQELKKSIEVEAENQREKKLQELNELNAEHARLVALIATSSCEYWEDYLGRKHHSGSCDRCQKRREAGDMTIELHEWPLPSNQLDAEAVVFELECPDALNLWRSATYKILCDLGGSARGEPVDPCYTLAGYQGLTQWSSRLRSSNHWITMASSAKSFLVAHYSDTSIPASERKVCVNNGLIFKPFDSAQETWASAPFTETSFSKYGTFTLPAGSPYRYLQYSLEGTSHTSNQILADQHDCPNELNFHEHYAFGTLRSGPRLQWMNIIRGLEENILTFSHKDVDALFNQVAWQIGRLSKDNLTRDWHMELLDPQYSRVLVALALRVLDHVRSNWLEATTVKTIVMLVAHLLSSMTDAATQSKAYHFLREARAVTFSWLGVLSDKLRDAELEYQALDYQQRVCEMAAICRSTYDVDDSHLPERLSDHEDCLALVSCSMTLYDKQLANPKKAPRHLQVLLSRDRRLAHKVLPIVLKRLVEMPRFLDASVSCRWDSYRPSSTGWIVLANSRWVTMSTASTSEEKSQEVHLDLLEGSLLRVLDVVPAKYLGMAFTTGTRICGNWVSFCMEEQELVVQARQNCSAFELIPHSKISGDLPYFLSSDYHHWVNLSTRDIEFRLLASPWSSSSTKWQLRFSSPSSSVIEQIGENGSTLLVDMHSLAFTSIARQLEPLESSRYLHVTRSSAGKINAELPRLKLAFFVNGDLQLESCNLRGHVVDERQSVGALFGLHNQLALCPKDTVVESLPQSHVVLIPYGAVNFGAEGDHSRVTVDCGSERHLNFYQYKIDTDLGYLASDNPSLTSRLYKIYLHALTSHCLPDPLTGRTGVEEALHELSESATLSFDQIDQEQARLLQLIGALTPRRVYYPSHLRSMQTTQWANLPPLSQHYTFSVAANLILERASELQLFSPLGFDLEPYRTQFNETILKRVAARTRDYYPPGAVARLPTVSEGLGKMDCGYEARDHRGSGWTQRGQAASWASGVIHRRWGKATYWPCELTSLAESWNTISGPSTEFSLTYSLDWSQLQLSSRWIPLYDLCRHATDTDRYQLCICLAAAMYSDSPLPQNLIPILAAFATNHSFLRLAPPTHRSYLLDDKYHPTNERVREFIADSVRDIRLTPAIDIPRNKGESNSDLGQRRQRDYNQRIATLKSRLTQLWMDCWPHTPTTPSGDYSAWIDVAGCLQHVQAYFRSCSKNVELKTHLDEVSRTVSARSTTAGLEFHSTTSALPVPRTQLPMSNCLLASLRLDRIMEQRACPKLRDVLLEPNLAVLTTPGSPPETSRLQALLTEFRTVHAQPIYQKYGADLESSRKDLAQAQVPDLLAQLPSLRRLEANRCRYRAYMQDNLESIQRSLGPASIVETIASMAGIWPRLTPRIILGTLTLHVRKITPSRWQGGLKIYARSYLEYQRSQRLISLALSHKQEEFQKELDVFGMSTGIHADDPDWLLVQIDGNFSTRSLQAQVAQEMIAPSSSENTVLQLNMGEGKSSVIVPIVAASLADCSRLVRVVVLKPLWRQMFQLLVNRLGGLVNRRIYFLPFGRHIRVDSTQAKRIQDMYAECMRDGGVLLVQPEHIQSFRLMGIDQLVASSTSEESDVANALRKTQNWLLEHSRDILDESDEVLHVRYQLIYTVGQQQPLEGHPDRWATTQQLLSLVAKHIARLNTRYPDQLMYEPRRGGQFPSIRLMPDSDEVIVELTQLVAEDAVAGHFPSLNLRLLPLEVRKSVLGFLTVKDISKGDAAFLKHLDPSLQKGLLLLRGLLACGIMAFALKSKRYRVDYGLHLKRSLLAVPYHAKDIPSLRAEFGHPDVAVVLTCLSYYNEGLTGDQLNTCFERLYKLDNPVLEYEQWVRRNKTTPTNLRQLSGVNLKDHEQFLGELVPAFSRNSAVVNFFLTAVVFPRQAKQFPHKLSTSGWDLAEVKTHVTTGFSGTNDNRYLLPTSIAQSDPVKQSSTNALVLTYLLRPENDHYLCIRAANDDSCSAKEFLNLLVKQDPEIRVLLDVGAQMLGLENDELVKHWLKLRPDVAAAVYFDDKDELVILPQNGSPVRFSSSPLSQQMDKCIVYLDDGHTRGTDLKLPRATRAAVTLGPKVTKDRLLQGCMRMRKLGHGQSVIFCAPTEIDTQIRNAASLTSADQIHALDVLRWAMLETCKELEHHISHWAQQGVDYHRRADAQRDFAQSGDIDTLKGGWTSPESRSLQGMYGASGSTATFSESFTQTAFGIDNMKQRLESLGLSRLEDPSMDEEQEREVSHEVERERQIERPPKLQPAAHIVHEDVRCFVRTGFVPANPTGIVPLRSTSQVPAGTWSSKLCASGDFFGNPDTSR